MKVKKKAAQWLRVQRMKRGRLGEVYHGKKLAKLVEVMR